MIVCVLARGYIKILRTLDSTVENLKKDLKGDNHSRAHLKLTVQVLTRTLCTLIMTLAASDNLRVRSQTRKTTRAVYGMMLWSMFIPVLCG